MLLLVPIIMASSIYFFTRGQKKSYTSETVIYTGIASGYSLNGNNKADFFATNNAFDNLLSLINSRETKEEVAVSLLAKHLMLKKPDLDVLSLETFEELQKLVPENIRKKVVRSSEEETKQQIIQMVASDESSELFRMINSDLPYYSISALREIKAVRISNSDLIKITYETNDAAICKSTLEYMVEIFMKKHRNLREGQTSNVIAYFEREVAAAFKRLDSCEQIFLEFNKSNDIINYYEQTKAVAGEKEGLYSLEHSLSMERKAKEKAVDKVNDDLKGKIYQSLYGTNIIEQRDQLGLIYNNMAMEDVINRKTGRTGSRQLDSLKMVASAIEKKLSSSIDGLYQQSNMPKGIPTKSVLDEWVKTTLDYEQSKARLSLMDKRKSDFDVEYKKLAPLGAMLKKIERQISVAEQEYLELLHGLNLARLTQQNNELTSKLTIVDPPYLPLRANASKRKMMIIVGFLAGFVIILAMLLTRFLLNSTLQQPSKAYKKIGITLIGIYPLLNLGKVFLDKANHRLIQQLITKIQPGINPITIAVISNQQGEGKTMLINIWKKMLTDLGYSVSVIKWNKKKSKTEKVPAEINFIEFPSLDSIVLTPQNIPTLDNAFLICRANRIWGTVDKDMLNIFTKNSGIPPSLILNGVNLDYAEELIGEMPKNRTKIHAYIKQLIKFEFGKRNSF